MELATSSTFKLAMEGTHDQGYLPVEIWPEIKDTRNRQPRTNPGNQIHHEITRGSLEVKKLAKLDLSFKMYFIIHKL